MKSRQNNKEVSKYSLGNFLAFKVIISVCICFFCASAGSQTNALRMTRNMMGTQFTIIVHSNEDATEAIDRAFNEIIRVNDIFSTYDDNSEVARLNSTRKWFTGSPELLHLISLSEDLNTLSQGAFDIKIGAASKIWKKGIKEQQKPSPNDLDRVLKKKRRIKIKADKVKTNKNTLLDFGAIAKGYAVDKAFEKLQSMGFDTILVDGGGDIRLGQAPHSSQGWKVSQFLENNRIAYLSNCAIASSGGSYQWLENESGERQSHIIDPKAMEGISAKIGVTVIGKNCTIADALSTTLSVLGDYKNLRKHYDFKVNIKSGDEWILKEF